MEADRLAKAFELFDSYNSKDPNSYHWNGKDYPQELFFSLQVYGWVIKLDTQASEALLLASRCQHIGRWESPRSSYPDGKAGYLNWRTNLAKFHSEKAASLLREAGYDEKTIDQVKRINLKQGLKTDHEVQTMENALCLVFLQFEYDSFIDKHDDEKVLRILRKSWGKMTQPGRDIALTINFSERGNALLERALSA